MKYKELKEYGILVREDGQIIGRKGFPLKGFLDKDGYIRVPISFTLNGIKVRKNKFVHRLVAKTFLNNYSEELVVNHLDCDNINNHYTNLEMTTISGNTKHAVDNNLLKIRGEDCNFNKYTEKLVTQILQELNKVSRYPNGNIRPGELIKIADKLGTTRFIVKNYSRRRKIWKHLNISSATTISKESTSKVNVDGNTNPLEQRMI